MSENYESSGVVEAQSASLYRDCAAFWNLNETDGTRADELGNNDLNQSTGPINVTGEGRPGNAIFLEGNGVDSNNLFRANADFNGLGPGTKDLALSLWVKPTALQAASQFITSNNNGSPGSRPGWELLVTSGAKLRTIFGDGVTFADTTYETILVDNTWYHIVVNCDRGGNIKLYLNGVKEVTESDISTYAATNLDDATLTGDWDLGLTTVSLTAFYSSFGYWHRLLESHEIAALYRSGAGRGWPF